MPQPIHDNYISQIVLTDNVTYYVKDAEAREWINEIVAGGLTFVVSWNGQAAPNVALIPAGVEVEYQGTTYTGTLAASVQTKPNIYLVYDHTTTSGRVVYKEYVTVNFGTEADPNYAWEVLGDTDVNFDDLGALAFKDTVTLNKGAGDAVLGADTTITAAESAVSFSGGTDDTFVKSYPGETTKLATTTVTGVAGEVTFDAVASASNVTASKVTLGTDTTASKVTVTTAGAANKTTLGTASTASKATAGTAVAVAKVAAAATNVSYIGNASTSSILETATVTGETLTFGAVAVAQGSVTGTNGTESITPYTFTDVTVYPDIAVSSDVTVQAVADTDVTVPVISTVTDVTASVVTTESKTAATKAATATTVATGAVDAAGAGATVMTGLGTATTGTAVTAVGTATAAAQTITVGTNDQVNVAAYNDLGVTVA